MEEKIYTIYMLIFPDNKKYIGATSLKPENRWRNGKSYGGSVREAIDYFGWENIKHEILKENLTQEESQYWERYYIQKFDTQNPEHGYNKYKGGEYHSIGWHQSEEAKEKNRQASKGNTNMLGKHHREESKEKIGQGNLGKKMSEESKEKSRQAQLGRHCYTNGEINVRAYECPSGFVAGQVRFKPNKKHSEESKQKNRQAVLGRHWYNDGNKMVFVYECPEGFTPGKLKKK